ncbi:hypothetical protein [Lactobacillus kefiranofaciens]|uniref:DUF4160 domain-containing protein n=1 Tax=Lactobacillus kefiranofaciens TaxID=267818 RepID=A0AAX3UH55_9LACO|nr:hypothetical protein [Lactobacillus kefiranofaciens]MCJ2171677.1 hypothetical protein [Lactobacillus kefiranofaciens]MDF4143118.1 hypothetical protein [Lactobacillus kefiranofaciens]URW72408.1 hypothetical protein MU859_10685 [Lactobacillus kefiranofaciens subsp. kefirgranum]URW74347.1 hypothetical protein MU860_10570 [Lactobacillus kefiranofaciens subsp. kefirgranum]WGO86944.1 hypothetical protein QEJ78_06235 [Lactobacillus kefiranofaciens]
MHVHVTKGHPNPASTKFWILKDGTAKLSNNKAELSSKDLKKTFLNCVELGRITLG